MNWPATAGKSRNYATHLSGLWDIMWWPSSPFNEPVFQVLATSLGEAKEQYFNMRKVELARRIDEQSGH